MKKIHLALTLATSLLLLAESANALQQFDGVEGKTIFVKMSTRDFNRIAIEGGRIRLIKGADSNLVLGDKDDVTGQALLKPLVKDPFSLFVFTDTSTYTLVVQPADIPSESILIKEVSKSAPKAGLIEKAGNYQKSIKLMLQAMAGETTLDGVEIHKTWQEIRLWENTRFALESVYAGDSISGEQYRLFNLGTSPIRIAEQEFYKKGVLAVAAQSLDLAPGASTRIYIVKRNEEKN